MKVATWNIAGGHPYIGHRPEALRYGYDRENLSYFTRELGNLRPDVAMLQEVHQHKVTRLSQSESLSQNLGLHATPPIPYDTSHIDKEHQLSLSTLARSPANTVIFHTLPHVDLAIDRPDGEKWVSFAPTGFLVTEMEHEGQRVSMINLHLHPFHYYERDFSDADFQYYRDAITSFLLSRKDTPTIVAGDFNYADLTKLFPKVFEEGGFSDAFFQATTPEKGQQDHILYSKHWKLNDVAIKKTMSDHYLCSADFSLKP